MTAKKSYRELISETEAIRKNIAERQARIKISRVKMKAEMAYMNIYGQILDLVLISNKINKMIEEATESDWLYAENCVPVGALLSMLSHTKSALNAMKDKFPEEYERSFSGGKVF